MAWKDLMVRVGMDSKGFRAGASGIKRDTQGLKNSMADLAAKMSEQGRQLRKLGTDGKGASNVYRALKQEIKDNNEAYRSMARELTAVERAQGKVTQGSQKMQSSMDSGGVSDMMGGLASRFGPAAIGAGLLALGKSAVDVQMQFEKMGVVLTNTLGSSSAAQKAMRDIQKFAAATPFQVDELTESYLRLANRGMQPTMEQMRQMGDLAASQGKSFIQLTEAILDAATGEFERLKEFGIKGSKEGDRVTLMFKNQKVEVENTADAISNAIREMGDYEGVAGGMAAISATLSGKLSNLSDNWSLLLNNMTGAGSVAVTVVDGLNSILQPLVQVSDGVKLNAKLFSKQYFQQLTGELPYRIIGDEVLYVDGRIEKLNDRVIDSLGAWNDFNGELSQTESIAQSAAKSLEKVTKAMSGRGAISQQYRINRDGQTENEIGERLKSLKEERANVGMNSNAYKELGRQIDELESKLGKKKSAGVSSSATKTAADAYRDLQSQLQLTREYLTFVGAENEYVAKATDMTAAAMERTFMMGGEQAKQYAAILKGELDALLVSTRNTSPLAPLAPTKINTPKSNKVNQDGSIMSGLSKEFQRIRLEAAAFGSQYDALGQQISAVSSLISKSISGEIQLSVSGYQELLEKLRELEEAKRAGLQTETANQNSMAQTAQMAQSLGGAMGGLFENLAAGYEGVGSALQGFIIDILNMAQTMISANLAVASSSIAAWANATFGPAGPAVAAVAIAGVFGLVKGAIGKSKGVKLAKGGLAYGETMATVGDNPGARFDPEVVAPLSKLQGMLETRETVGGTFRIDGADLVLAYDNAKRKTKAFGR